MSASAVKSGAYTQRLHRTSRACPGTLVVLLLLVWPATTSQNLVLALTSCFSSPIGSLAFCQRLLNGNPAAACMAGDDGEEPLHLLCAARSPSKVLVKPASLSPNLGPKT
eukprot:1844890-Rhodomonas_salina.2